MSWVPHSPWFSAWTLFKLQHKEENPTKKTEPSGQRKHWSYFGTAEPAVFGGTGSGDEGIA